MKLRFTTIDVFTSQRYVGNPVAIVHLPDDPTALTQDQKQRIAREFNLSETVFIHPPQNISDTIKIDIFTCHAQINFAGHPTIGTASYLLEQDPALKALLVRAGPIPIFSNGRVTSALVPHNVRVHQSEIPHSLSFEGKINPIVSIVKGMAFILLRLPSLEKLGQINESLWPNTYETTPLDEDFREGLIATYAYVLLDVVDGIQQIRSRMHGSREDPATGSGSSALCCYLALQSEKRVCEFQLVQGVEMGRRSVIEIRVTKTEDGKGIQEVMLSGETIKVMEGSIEV